MTRTASTASPAAAEAFEQAWDEFFAAARRARGRAARDSSGGLTLAQYHLVAPIAVAGGELPCGEAAVAAGVAGPTATRMLDSLEREEIVTREHSTADRRVVTVRLTAKGRRAVREKGRAISAKRREIYRSLSEDDRAQATVLLGRLAEAVEQL
ncbi:MAG TPA: MarR family transcriptional regulator [Thermoleophilaceae bacterium]|jgi:DNA-binding MarR family transcriptional regulator